jgi:hypothetical protein
LVGVAYDRSCVDQRITLTDGGLQLILHLGDSSLQSLVIQAEDEPTRGGLGDGFTAAVHCTLSGFQVALGVVVGLRRNEGGCCQQALGVASSVITCAQTAASTWSACTVGWWQNGLPGTCLAWLQW